MIQTPVRKNRFLNSDVTRSINLLGAVFHVWFQCHSAPQRCWCRLHRRHRLPAQTPRRPIGQRPTPPPPHWPAPNMAFSPLVRAQRPLTSHWPPLHGPSIPISRRPTVLSPHWLSPPIFLFAATFCRPIGRRPTSTCFPIGQRLTENHNEQPLPARRTFIGPAPAAAGGR